MGKYVLFHTFNKPFFFVYLDHGVKNLFFDTLNFSLFQYPSFLDRAVTARVLVRLVLGVTLGVVQGVLRA